MKSSNKLKEIRKKLSQKCNDIEKSLAKDSKQFFILKVQKA